MQYAHTYHNRTHQIIAVGDRLHQSVCSCSGSLCKYRIAGNFHESVKYKILWRKLSWIHHQPDIMCNKPKWATPFSWRKLSQTAADPRNS